MADFDHMEISVAPDEAAGLASYIDFRWYRYQEELGDSISDDTRGLVEELVALLDLHDDLTAIAEGEGRVRARRHLLVELIREGGEYARETVAHALRGDYGDAAADQIRRGKGLMALAEREGLYEGVVI